MTLDIDFRLSSSRMNIHVDGRFLKSVIMYTPVITFKIKLHLEGVDKIRKRDQAVQSII